MSSATATVLVTNELLGLIFRHISPAPWDELEDPTGNRPTWPQAMEGPRKDLYSLALCCKAFTEPALRCLWAGLNSLVPLIKLLPDLELIEGEYYFHGTIESDSRFCHVSNYIRLLDISVRDGLQEEELRPSVSPQVFAVICRQLQGEQMLMFLNKLYIYVPPNAESSDYKELSALPAILSPSIDAITLTGDGLGNPLFLKYYLPLIAQGAKFVKYLKIADIDAESGGFPGSSVIDALLKLSHLQTLELDIEATTGAHPERLLDVTRTLTKLTNLKLSIHFSEHCMAGGPWVSSRDCIAQPPHLSNLESLCLHTILTERHGICGCLPASLLCEAKDLTVWVPEDNILSQVECYEALAKSLSRHAPELKTLCIAAEMGQEASMHPQSISLLIRTLPLSELDIHYMDVLYGQQGLEPIFNTTSAESANASKLKILRLPATRSSRSLSVTDLLKVARYAVNLEYLSLHFMSGTKEGVIRNVLDVEKKVREVSCSALRTLDIADNYMQTQPRILDAIECNELAELLDLLFPALGKITHSGIEDSWEAAPNSIDWSNIDHVRKLHQANRK